MKRTIYSSVFALAAAVTMVGCGDPLLDDLNSNIEVGSSDISVAETYDQATGLFLTAQQKMHDVGTDKGAHVYQVQFNIHIDNYSGYLASTQNFGGNLPSTYRYFAQYCDGPKASFFNVAQATLPVMRSAGKLNLRELGAMCNIMYCFSALELSDVYGPFPWTDYKNDVQEPPVTYEPMNQIYDSLFVNLKDAGEILKKFNETPKAHRDTIQKILDQYDKICGRNIDTWRQFANSIRLRMAMRMSNIDPERAKAEAEAAINEGLITQNIEFNTMIENGTRHPTEYLANNWNDTRLNASLENIMKCLNVPFMNTLFDKNSGNILDEEGNVVMAANADIIGIRTGIQLTPRDDNNQYIKYSSLNGDYANTPLAIFKLAERYFLEAEANLRWGDDDSYVESYVKGIKEMFAEHNLQREGSEFGLYYSQMAATPTSYVDPHDPRNNTDNLITIGVAIDPKEPKSVILEKIITQKWLALFPMGLEAWNDLRRTGYPRIFPTDDIGDGSLGNGFMIRRIRWNETDAAAANDILTSGIPALGGLPNMMGSYLWWDVPDPSGMGDNRRWETGGNNN